MSEQIDEGVDTRAGVVALVGRPNAGKSTLLNAFVGEKLSIVTRKAQTTWRRVSGIYTSERAQVIFVDTPGLLEARDLLQRTLLEEARRAIRDADLLLLVVDVTRSSMEVETAAVRASLAEGRAPLFVAVNKVDVADQPRVEEAVRWVHTELGGRAFPVSAYRGQGVMELLNAVEEALPVSPFLHPAEDIASQPLRFFVAELVRETIFEQFRQEVPYSVFCVVEDFKEDQDPAYIQATLFVERDSQKHILVGQRGAAIRDLGTAAREKVERLMGRSVYLELWVKTLPGWRRRRGHLTRLGFRVPEDHESKA